MGMKNKLVCFTILILLITFTNIQAQEKSLKDPANSITAEELKGHIYYLASDELEGRGTGQPGYKKAVEYACSQFRAAGIKPFLKDEKGNPTYLQTFDLRKIGYKSVAWEVKTPMNKYHTADGEEIKASSLESFGTGQVMGAVFIGYGISEPEHGWDDLKGLDLDNKMVIMLTGVPKKNGKPILPEKISKSYEGRSGTGKKFMKLRKNHKIFRYFFLHDSSSDLFFKDPYDATSYFFVRHYDEKKPSLFDSSTMRKPTCITATKEMSEKVMEGQVYSPYNNPEDPLHGYKTFPMKDFHIKLDSVPINEKIPSWNVIGVIPGTDPELKDQYLMIGAHLDHLGKISYMLYNGANDNASGSAGVMEVAEALAQKAHARSILFCLWGSEEYGLLGSKSFVWDPPLNLDAVKLHINMDMIGRDDEEKEIQYDISIQGLEKHYPSLNEKIEKLNSKLVDLNLLIVGDEPGRSDHLSFKDKNIPAFTFFSGIHDDYHTQEDDAEKIDYEKVMKTSRLAYYILETLANAENLDRILTKQ